MNISLLRRLRSASGQYVPLAEIGADLGAVQADLAELERFGFGLERHPWLGVAYRHPAERLCPDQIEHELGTTWVGRRIAVWERVTSTNDLAARAAGSRHNEGLVVLAEEQTAGRGRRGRTWHAPPRSSLLMSVLLFPPDPLSDPAWLTALGAVAVAEVLEPLIGRRFSIKWPNDVRVEGRKLAGILVERGTGSVVGIGVNVTTEPDQLPLELHATTTSLSALGWDRPDRSELARSLIQRMDALYVEGLAIGPEPLSRAWRERSEFLGAWVELAAQAGAVRGRLLDLHLIEGVTLEVARGQTLRIPASQVLSLSPCSPGEPS